MPTACRNRSHLRKSLTKNIEHAFQIIVSLLPEQGVSLSLHFLRIDQMESALLDGKLNIPNCHSIFLHHIYNFNYILDTIWSQLQIVHRIEGRSIEDFLQLEELWLPLHDGGVTSFIFTDYFEPSNANPEFFEISGIFVLHLQRYTDILAH